MAKKVIPFYMRSFSTKCVACGKDFFAPNPKQICCSQKCEKRLYKRLYMRKYQREHLDKKHDLDRKYRKKHREEIIKYLERWRMKKGKDWVRKYNQDKKEISRFGVLKKEIFERDDWQCQICGSSEKLYVRHVDNQGVKVPAKERNNNPDNLITICIKCHGMINLGHLSLNDLL